MKSKKKNLIIFIAILLISIVAFLLVGYYQLKISMRQYSYGYNNQKFAREANGSINIKNETTIQQNFKAKKNNLTQIKVAINGNENEKLKLKVVLKNITDNIVLKEEIIENKDILLAGNSIIDFEEQKDSKDKEYSLDITFFNVQDKLKIKYLNHDIATNRETLIDNQKFEGTIEINECYRNKSKEILFNGIAILLSIIIIADSIFIFLKKDISVEKAFLYIVPIISILFMIIMPMFKSHDEQRHWLRAYEVSEGGFFSQVHDGNVESELPKSVINPLKEYWRYIDYEDIKSAINTKLDKNDRDYTDMSYVAVYSPIQYIPQAIGIAIARIFTDEVLIMAYVARLTNLIVSLVILYLAIKIAPVGKKAFLLAALLPLSVEAISSMSPDGVTISICFLFVAYILNLIINKEKMITVKDKVILTILSLIIALCKIVYIPLVGLLLLLPKEKFDNRKKKFLTVSTIIGISIIINAIWLITANSYLSTSSEGISNGQIMYILKNPIEYIKIFLYSLNVNGQRYLTSLFGGELGWNEFSLYFIVPYTYCALFLFTAITDKDMKQKLNLFGKILIAVITIIIIALIFTSLYVQWTKPGETKIAGVQGRYFIPILPLIAILLNNIKIETKYKEENIIKAISITTLVLQVYIMLSIVVNHL